MSRGPVDLVLVRHGESEGNLAQWRSKHGIQKDWEGEFATRHSSKYRLTDKGRSHARAAGDYIKKNIYSSFDRCYSSEYIRSVETAGLLDLDHAHWFIEFNLRERDLGILAEVSKKQLQEQEAYSAELERRERDLFYWQPPGGESIATMCLRVDRFLKHLEKACAGLKVLVVCHGNIMEGFRILLESLTQKRWTELRDSKSGFDKIHPSQIFWYTRRNPETKKVHGNLNWVKSICPWDLSRSHNEWETINRPIFSSNDLLTHVETIPQLVNNNRGHDVLDNQTIEDEIESYQPIPGLKATKKKEIAEETEAEPINESEVLEEVPDKEE